MDTPDKNQIAAPSLSKFEDSPVFNYINNLSPIEPVKSVHSDQSFNSVIFTSPSSLFASPRVSLLRESRFFLKSNLSPDPFKSELRPCGDENKKKKGITEAIKLSDEQVGSLTLGISDKDASAKPLSETSECKQGSSISKSMSFDVTEMTLGASSLLVQSKKDDLAETQLFKNDNDMHKICQIGQSEEAASSNWVSSVDILNADSTMIENNSEEQNHNNVDPGMSFVKTVLELQDNRFDLDINDFASPSGNCKLNDMRRLENEFGEVGDVKDVDQTPEMLSNTLLDKLVVSGSRDDHGEKCNEPSCKNTVRRRCLDFEVAGGHKKQTLCEPNCSSSIPLESDCKGSLIEKNLVPSKRGSNYSSSILPGIGLHLNALAATSKNIKVVKCGSSNSGKQLIRMRSSISSFESFTSSQNVNKPSILKREPVPSEIEADIKENASQNYANVGDGELDHCSPERKRCKPEPVGESKACKRCNCKRSKCLKLYCECFAAGLYCVEPCSCLDCFNKPIYEDTVLETRRQIESRNPLAFAPKVIRTADSVLEYGDDSNKTPASARHKRGCNCKRSSCLKKYCECFQGGVGCSLSCRCEGCKNSFGRKDGGEDTEYKEEESEIKNDTVQKSEEEHPHLQLIPSEISRGKRSGSSIHILGPSGFYRQPEFETHNQIISEDKNPKLLRSNSSPANTMKTTTSPNSKRVLPPRHEIESSTSRSSGRRLTVRLQFPSVAPPEQ